MEHAREITPPPLRPIGESAKHVPTFHGEGDMELFIEQLQELAEVEDWGEAITILKAREGLQGQV